jgi:RNase P protein component
MDQRFRASAHIRQRRDFKTVYDTGRKLHGRTMTIFALPRPGIGSRLGIAATRKLDPPSSGTGQASIRELFRLNPAPPGLDIVGAAAGAVRCHLQ